MAWGRLVSLKIGTDPTNPSKAIEVADLHIDFEVNRSIAFAENTANFKIFNASEQVRNQVLVEGANLVFEAGYEDIGTGTLFMGNITKSVSIKAGADWITDIQAASTRSAQDPLKTTPVVLSYDAEASLSDALADIADLLGIVLTGGEQVSDITFINGFVHTGSVRVALASYNKVLNSYGYGLFIDNNELVIFSRVGSSTYKAIFLDYECGLLSVDDKADAHDEELKVQAQQERIKKATTKKVARETAKTKASTANTVAKAQSSIAEIQRKKITFKSLLHPKARPNGLVTIKTPHIDGTFLMETLRFQGTNYTEEFYLSGEATL
jgi:hypothetical protein